MKTKKYLLDALLLIQEDEGATPDFIREHSGICAAVEHIFLEAARVKLYGKAQAIMQGLFKTWVGYSGNPHFPVGGEGEYYNTPNHWTGESGELRHELLNHMISELSK